MRFRLKEKFPFGLPCFKGEKKMFFEKFLGSDPFNSHTKPGQQKKTTKTKSSCHIRLMVLHGVLSVLVRRI